MRAGCGPTGRSTADSTIFSFSARATSSASARSSSASRVRRRVAAVDDCSLLRLPVSLFQKLLARASGVPSAARGACPTVRLPAPRTRATRLRRRDPARRSIVLCGPRRRTESSPVGAEAAVELDDGPTPASPRRRRRFPHIFQLDEMDCGAACLAMVCRFFGRNVSISYIREVVRTSTDGTTLERDHARRRGARARRSFDQRLARAASTSCRCRQSCTGRETTGSCSTASTATGCGSPTRARGLRRADASRVSRELERLCLGDRLRRRPSRRHPSRSRRLAWLKPFLRPHRWYLVAAVVLADARGCARAGAADPHAGRRRSHRSRDGPRSSSGSCSRRSSRC